MIPVTTKKVSEETMRQQLASRFQAIQSSASANGNPFADLVAQSAAAYKASWGREMSECQKMILLNSFNQLTNVLVQRDRVPMQNIVSAVQDIAKVDNPLSFLYNLTSILVPNFAYTLVVGMQPIPTKESPIFFPQVTANDDRNGITKGTKLLGATNWLPNNNYTTNKVTENKPSGTTTTFTYTVPGGATGITNILPGSVILRYNSASGSSFVVLDDGKGALIPVPGFTNPTNAGTVTATTITLNLATAGTANDRIDVTYRYDFAADTKPAQAVFEWVSSIIRAEPYRVRQTYSLDNFYEVKQVLSGYDVGQVLSSSLAGYINKDISGSVFEDMYARTDATFTWNSVAPTGVSWVLHRMSLIQPVVEAGNQIRANVARSGGNYLVAGSDWMSTIETLDTTVWQPVDYSGGEPIGPYEAGKLLGKFTVIKNQDYPAAVAVQGYKRDDLDASVMGGSFIGLFSTPDLPLDDLSVVSGLGSQFGYKKIFDNSLVEMVYQR